jgi:hypothetical protein
MSRRTGMALAWVLMAGLLVTVGCESSSSSDGGGGEIVAKSVKEDLRVGIEESVLNIAERGAGTLRAEVSWADSRRIRAYFTVSGPGNILIDRTQSDSPLTIETAVEAIPMALMWWMWTTPSSSSRPTDRLVCVAGIGYKPVSVRAQLFCTDAARGLPDGDLASPGCRGIDGVDHLLDDQSLFCR